MKCRFSTYGEVCRRLRKRYTDAAGRLVISVGGVPSRYYTLESIAAVKYLGCDPTKLGCPGLENIKIRGANTANVLT